MDFESKLFDPIEEFLQKKKHYYKEFSEITFNNKNFFDRKIQQYKTEKWLCSELSIVLKENK